MAIKLLESGRDDFVVLEKADDVGGTWRDNTYPGCECDIPSHMYSFSYDLNPTWSRSYSPQPEIWDYMRGVTDRRGLRPWIDFGVEVTGAAWDESRQRWTVQTAGGQAYEARVVVCGIGALHIPRLPSVLQSILFLRLRPVLVPWLHRRYGDHFTLTIVPGSRKFVVFHHADEIKEIFAADPAVLHAGEGNAILGPLMVATRCCSPTRVCTCARKLLMPAFNGAALRRYRSLVDSIAKEEVDRWSEGR